MAEVKKRVSEDRAVWERLLSFFPGYRGYKDREILRETDKIVREGIFIRLKELQAGLQEVRASFEVTQLEGNRLQIDIKAENPALAYLETQRISPTVKDGIVRILIQRPAAKP